MATTLVIRTCCPVDGCGGSVNVPAEVKATGTDEWDIVVDSGRLDAIVRAHVKTHVKDD